MGDEPDLGGVVFADAAFDAAVAVKQTVVSNAYPTATAFLVPIIGFPSRFGGTGP